MKKEIYKRLKSIFKTEQNALQNICTKKSIKPSQLKACHEEKCFAWELIEEAKDFDYSTLDPTGQNKTVFAKEDYTKQEATQRAMQHFETFEGNLNANHTETHYVFTKVR